MRPFGTADVSRLADIPLGSVRAMVRARYVSPAKGPRGVLRFSFQDVVLLRTARTLLAARVPARRVGNAMRALRAQLPADLPARGLSIASAGGRVVVHESGKVREAESGQLLLAFEVKVDGTKIELFETTASVKQSAAGDVATQGGDECQRQFDAALQLEDSDVGAAVDAYAACVARHSHHGARANLGRLLHLQGKISEAVRLYREAHGEDADVLYNLGVALEDLGQCDEAIAAYQRALELDAEYSDAHHNLARLWEQAGDARRALRHWNAYRKLAGSAGPAV
ncbi:MAG: tetratricopeptide repeat protein [Steroidobacteraceae bacterium]